MLARSWPIVGSAIISVVLLGACAGQGPAAAPSPTGKAFFAGKTITFISPDKPGGQSDTLMRVIAPSVAKYLGATVQVTNVATGGTVPGQDQAAAAPPDGLTVGVEHVSKDVYAKAIGKPTVDFPLDQQGLLGSIPAAENLLVAAPSSPYKTIQELLGTTQTVNVLTTGGSGAMSVRALIAAYGAHLKIVTGYDSSHTLVQGFLRGDGPVTDTAANPLESAVLGGAARPLLALSPISPGKLQKALKGVPTLEELAKSDPPKTSASQQLLKQLIAFRETPETWLFVPKGTPADRVAALHDAVKAALLDPAIQKQMADQGVAPGYASPKDAVADIHKMQAAAPIIAKYK